MDIRDVSKLIHIHGPSNIRSKEREDSVACAVLRITPDPVHQLPALGCLEIRFGGFEPVCGVLTGSNACDQVAVLHA